MIFFLLEITCPKIRLPKTSRLVQHKNCLAGKICTLSCVQGFEIPDSPVFVLNCQESNRRWRFPTGFKKLPKCVENGMQQRKPRIKKKRKKKVVKKRKFRTCDTRKKQPDNGQLICPENPTSYPYRCEVVCDHGLEPFPKQQICSKGKWTASSYDKPICKESASNIVKESAIPLISKTFEQDSEMSALETQTTVNVPLSTSAPKGSPCPVARKTPDLGELVCTRYPPYQNDYCAVACVSGYRPNIEIINCGKRGQWAKDSRMKPTCILQNEESLMEKPPVITTEVSEEESVQHCLRSKKKVVGNGKLVCDTEIDEKLVHGGSDCSLICDEGYREFDYSVCM